MTDDHDKILCERLATSIDHGICKCAERSRIAAIERELDYARNELRRAIAIRDIFAKALVFSVDETENLQRHPVDKSPDLQVPNNDMVICPKCVHQFRAIPVSVQHELAAERERRKAAEAALRERPGQWYPTPPIVAE